jgi:hypothetical protein
MVARRRRATRAARRLAPPRSVAVGVAAFKLVAEAPPALPVQCSLILLPDLLIVLPLNGDDP